MLIRLKVGVDVYFYASAQSLCIDSMLFASVSIILWSICHSIVYSLPYTMGMKHLLDRDKVSQIDLG